MAILAYSRFWATCTRVIQQRSLRMLEILVQKCASEHFNQIQVVKSYPDFRDVLSSREERMIAKASMDHTGRFQLDRVASKRAELKLFFLSLTVLHDLRMRSSHYVSGVRLI